MESILIRDEQTGSSARVAAHLGFNCHEFRAHVGEQVIDVIEAPEDFAGGSHRPSSYGIPVLFPFPNRIRGGKFEWNGRSYHLPETEVANDGNGNAIHGFCLDRPWRVVDRAESFVVGEFQLSRDAADRLQYWPADFLIRVKYAVSDAALDMTVTVRNPSETPLPWGFGTHPYFRVPLAAESQPAGCLVESPVGDVWELIDCLPTGERGPIPADRDLRDGVRFGSVGLDDVFSIEPTGTGLRECVIYDEAAGLQVSQFFGPEYRELVVYTPPNRHSVCLEPYTCVTDAINLQARGIDAGWRVLEPGGEFQTPIRIQAGPIVV